MLKEKIRKITSGSSVRDAYFRDIANCTFLTVEQEQKLATAPGGQEELIKAHTWLAVKIAMQHKADKNNSLDDIIQEANLGLIHAANKFNSSMNNRFSTYAIWWIRHYIQRYLDKNHSLIRLPFRKVKELREKSDLVAGKSPAEQMRAGVARKNLSAVPQLIQSKSDDFSLELLSSEGNCPEKLLLLKEKFDIEEKLMEILSDEEYRVVYERVFSEHKKISVRIIAERLGMQEVYARRLLNRACKKMRQRAIEWGLVE